MDAVNSEERLETFAREYFGREAALRLGAKDSEDATMLLAFYADRVEPINQERLHLLEEAVAEMAPEPARLDAMVDALVLPIARRAVGVAVNNRQELRRMQLFFSEPLPIRQQLRNQIYLPLFQRFSTELHRALPEVPGVELTRRLDVAVASLMGTCARLDIILDPITGEPSESAMWDIVHTLRDGLCGLFRAPFRAALNEQVFIDDGERRWFVPMNSIACIHADGNYSHVHFSGGGHTYMHRSMKQWSNLLPKVKFARIHRSTIINRALVRELKHAGDGRLEIYLHGEPGPCVVSRRKAREVEVLLTSGH